VQVVLSEDDENCIIRTQQTFKDDFSTLRDNLPNSNTRSLKSESLMFTLNNYKHFMNPSVDILHDVLEDVAPLEVNLFLNISLKK
jgi:hypothetical protein